MQYKVKPKIAESSCRLLIADADVYVSIRWKSRLGRKKLCPRVGALTSLAQLEHDTFHNRPMEEGAMLSREREQFLDRS